MVREWLRWRRWGLMVWGMAEIGVAVAYHEYETTKISLQLN
jgi:hypothetical protein